LQEPNQPFFENQYSFLSDFACQTNSWRNYKKLVKVE